MRRLITILVSSSLSPRAIYLLRFQAGPLLQPAADPVARFLMFNIFLRQLGLLEFHWSSIHRFASEDRPVQQPLSTFLSLLSALLSNRLLRNNKNSRTRVFVLYTVPPKPGVGVREPFPPASGTHSLRMQRSSTSGVAQAYSHAQLNTKFGHLK